MSRHAGIPRPTATPRVVSSRMAASRVASSRVAASRAVGCRVAASRVVSARVAASRTVICAIVAGLIGLGGMVLPGVASAATEGISGAVTNASTHAGIEGAQVCATQIGSVNTTSCIDAGAGGEYELPLTQGDYKVEFTGYVCKSTCEQTYAAKEYPSTVVVEVGKVMKGVNAELEKPGGIGGRVTSGGAPAAEDVQVCASESEFEFGFGFGCQRTNSNGEYTIEHLPPGIYKVEFIPTVPSSCKVLGCQRANYLTQYWNDEPTNAAANTVTVSGGKIIQGISAELQAGGHIAGRVINASIYAQPIADVRVCANSTALNQELEPEESGECAFTNANGEYTIQTLASHGYEVEFTGEVCTEQSVHKIKCVHPYISQFYQSIVSVIAPGTTSGINGSLLERSPTKPVNTAAPALTGTAAAGQALSCSTGAWANNPTSLTYRWLRNGVAIAGQAADTYTVQVADQGTGIACEVTATNGAGSSASISNTVAIPEPAPGVGVIQSVAVRGGTVFVTLRCTGASACSGVMRITTRVTTGRGRRKHGRTITVGLASFSLALDHDATLRVYLTAQGRKLLTRAGRRGLEVRIAGRGLRARTVVLRLPARRR